MVFMRSILLILVFWFNFIMLYQPVMVVCLSMRFRWGKERRIGDKKIAKTCYNFLENLFSRKLNKYREQKDSERHGST